MAAAPRTPRGRVRVWTALGVFWALILVAVSVGIGITARPGGALGINLVIAICGVFFVLGSVLTAASGYYAHRFSLRRWRLKLDGRTVVVEVRESEIGGPAVFVDGEEVAAAQDPPWAIYPHAAKRLFRLDLSGHPAYIFERTFLGGQGWARYELDVDARRVR